MTHIEGSQAHHSVNRQKLTDKIQRWAPMVGGATLAILGLSRRSKSGLAVAAAGGLVAYIATNSNANALLDQLVGSSSVVINAAPEELYQFWLDFEHLPLFMRHLEAVTVSDNKHSHWVALGPLGTRIEWNAEITTQQQNQFIAWHSLPGSDIDIEGRVEFRALRANRGTLISAKIHYRPSAKHAGLQYAKLLGKDPSFLIRQDLRRLKALIETGEIPTTEGQSHGPLSATAGVARTLNPIPRDTSVL